ncbi:MAG: sugar phosphate isomerase/epimerase, partial [Chloroflexota bacterium]|nr:sugar phosphate isomerase/epimerase [Chloroflexota bacterium]
GVLEGSGAVISSIGVYGSPLETGETDLEVRRTWEELIDNAHLFGTDIVGGFTGRLRGRPINESVPRFREVFDPLAERALRKGVRLAFENCAMDGSWQAGDWNIAHGPDAWQLMFEAVPAPNLGLEWEPCHQMLNLIEPLPQLREWAPRIFHLHGKDASILWDVVHEFGVNSSRPYVFHRTPGFGDTDWVEVLSELRRCGFTGAIDIEGWHDPVYRDELEMTGQVFALNYLKECRGGKFVPNPS